MINEIVMVRTENAGVHFGRLASEPGTQVTLTDARRVWFWDGAATLSELAVAGTSKPAKCKIPTAVPTIVVLGVIEVIPMTEAAIASLTAVPVWSGQ